MSINKFIEIKKKFGVVVNYFYRTTVVSGKRENFVNIALSKVNPLPNSYFL